MNTPVSPITIFVTGAADLPVLGTTAHSESTQHQFSCYHKCNDLVFELLFVIYSENHSKKHTNERVWKEKMLGNPLNHKSAAVAVALF